MNIIEPTIANVHFKMKAKNVAMNNGSLKWSLDGLPSNFGYPGLLRISSGTHVNYDMVELKAKIPKARATLGVHISREINF